MNSAAKYSQERFGTSADHRFLLSFSNDEKQKAEKFITEATDVWLENNILSPLSFALTNHSRTLVIYLEWSKVGDKYKYKLDRQLLEWLELNDMTKDVCTESPWLFFDEFRRVFSIKYNAGSGVYIYRIANTFGRVDLQTFLEDLFMANRVCEVKGKWTLISNLYLIDNLSLMESRNVKKNEFTPDWFNYVLKLDEKRKRGLFEDVSET